MSFIPPTDLTPYLPKANQVTTSFVTLLFGNRYAEYTITPPPVAGGMFAVVPAATPAADVNRIASNDLAWSKFLTSTGTNVADPADVQACLIWYATHVYLPNYY